MNAPVEVEIFQPTDHVAILCGLQARMLSKDPSAGAGGPGGGFEGLGDPVVIEEELAELRGGKLARAGGRKVKRHQYMAKMKNCRL